MLLPCLSLSASRGRTEKSVFWDQNYSRPKQKPTTAEQLTYTQQTEQKACCPRQARPALLSDGQRYCLEGTEMLSACSQLSLAEAACAVGCTTDGKLVSFQFMVIAVMETFCP